MKTTTKAMIKPVPEIHQINKGDLVRICDYKNGVGLNGKLGTVTESNRAGYYIKIQGQKDVVHLTNLEGVKCLVKLTSAQELGQGSLSQDSDPDSPSKDLQKPMNFAQKSSTSDTPESSITEMSPPRRGRGRPKKLTSLPPALPANPSPLQETEEEKTTLETVSPTSKQELSESTPTTGRSRTSPDYSVSTTVSTLNISLSGLTSAGTMQNGSLSEAATLAAPIVDNGYSFLASPGALGSGTSGANPAGQNKLEVQLKEAGSIAPGEVSNPEFLEATLGLPIGWTDPQDKRTASELLAEMERSGNAAKPSVISSIQESLPLHSIASSTTTSKPRTIQNIDLTTRKLWISPEQIEEVSFTQIRESVDSEAIARYAELMQSEMWDFDRTPLPVLFEHENRYLIGDGHHRIEAARKIGADILCEIFPAIRIEDALLYSIKAIENTNHGLPLRPKDQRKRINMFLDLFESGKCFIPLPDEYETWSSRAIATYLNLPESGYRTIVNIRKEREKPPEEPPILKALSDRPLKQPTSPPVKSDSPAPSTRPASGGDSIASPAIQERPAIPSTPTNDTHDPTPNTLPPTNGAHLSDEELNNMGLLTSIGRSLNSIINQIDLVKSSDLSRLSEAIEVEKVRRLNLEAQ